MGRSAQRVGDVIMAEIKHSRADRMATVPLEWPVQVDGAEVAAVTLRRLTGGEVAALQEQMMGDAPSEAALIAAFADQPLDVISALDADDFLTLKDRVFDFLPKRIRAALEAASEATAAEEAAMAVGAATQVS